MDYHSDPRISRGDICTEQPKFDFLDIDLQLSMFCIAARTFEWTVPTEPFVRVARRLSTDVPKQNFVLDTMDYDCACSWPMSRARKHRPMVCFEGCHSPP